MYRSKLSTSRCRTLDSAPISSTSRAMATSDGCAAASAGEGTRRPDCVSSILARVSCVLIEPRSGLLLAKLLTSAACVFLSDMLCLNDVRFVSGRFDLLSRRRVSKERAFSVLAPRGFFAASTLDARKKD